LNSRQDLAIRPPLPFSGLLDAPRMSGGFDPHLPLGLSLNYFSPQWSPPFRQPFRDFPLLCFLFPRPFFPPPMPSQKYDPLSRKSPPFLVLFFHSFILQPDKAPLACLGHCLIAIVFFFFLRYSSWYFFGIPVVHLLSHSLAFSPWRKTKTTGLSLKRTSSTPNLSSCQNFFTGFPFTFRSPCHSPCLP